CTPTAGGLPWDSSAARPLRPACPPARRPEESGRGGEEGPGPGGASTRGSGTDAAHRDACSYCTSVRRSAGGLQQGLVELGQVRGRLAREPLEHLSDGIARDAARQDGDDGEPALLGHLHLRGEPPAGPRVSHENLAHVAAEAK